MQWDAGGDLLAVLPTSSPVVYVWSAVTQELVKVEVDAKVGGASHGARPGWVAAIGVGPLWCGHTGWREGGRAQLTGDGGELTAGLSCARQGRDVAAIAWSPTGATLVAATVKGHLVLYSAHERRRTALPGKHCNHVLCAAWGTGGRLALAGGDKLASGVHTVPAAGAGGGGAGERAVGRSDKQPQAAQRQQRQPAARACIHGMGPAR